MGGGGGELRDMRAGRCRENGEKGVKGQWREQEGGDMRGEWKGGVRDM